MEAIKSSLLKLLSSAVTPRLRPVVLKADTASKSSAIKGNLGSLMVSSRVVKSTKNPARPMLVSALEMVFVPMVRF